MTRRPRVPWWVLAALVLLGLLVPFVDRSAAPRVGPATTISSTPFAPATSSPLPDVKETLALLARLPVKGRAPRRGAGHEFRRALFGSAWVDVDENGCRTRDDVLRRDLTQLVLRDECVVIGGVLVDPYSNTRIVFAKARAAEVQIDHVVALSDAWQKGAQSWTPETRVRFANDPLNLLAVSAAANGAKSDSDAASWLPPYKPGRCAFVSRQVRVKARYGLWVTAAERDAIRRVLAGCQAPSR